MRRLFFWLRNDPYGSALVPVIVVIVLALVQFIFIRR